MDFRSIKSEKENDQKGMLLSMTVHVVLLLAMYFMPSLPPPQPVVPAQIVVELPKDLHPEMVKVRKRVYNAEAAAKFNIHPPNDFVPYK